MASINKWTVLQTFKWRSWASVLQVKPSRWSWAPQTQTPRVSFCCPLWRRRKRHWMRLRRNWKLQKRDARYCVPHYRRRQAFRIFFILYARCIPKKHAENFRTTSPSAWCVLASMISFCLHAVIVLFCRFARARGPKRWNSLLRNESMKRRSSRRP